MLNKKTSAEGAASMFYFFDREIHAETQEEFERTVSMNIRRLSRVVSTMTLNVVSNNE